MLAQSPHADLVDAATFRRAMSILASPLTIVTTVDGNGSPWGFTVSAFMSVSLAPPLVLVGADRAGSCHQALTTSDEFVVNVLHDRHHELATTFSTHGIDRFDGTGTEHFPGTRLPSVPDAFGTLRCRTWKVIEAGDHDLIIGAVLDIRLDEENEPLLWYRRRFRTLA